MTVARYVIRWIGPPVQGNRIENEYVKLGGGQTLDIQEANVIGWKSVRTKWGRYIDAGRCEAIPVRIEVA